MLLKPRQNISPLKTELEPNWNHLRTSSAELPLLSERLVQPRCQLGGHKAVIAHLCDVHLLPVERTETGSGLWSRKTPGLAPTSREVSGKIPSQRAIGDEATEFMEVVKAAGRHVSCTAGNALRSATLWLMDLQ